MIHKIRVIGLGYVGLAQALLFNDQYDVVGYDINKDKIRTIEKGLSPVKDKEFSDSLKRKKLKVTNTFTKDLSTADLIIIATPTHFNDETKSFDLTSIIETLKILESFKSKAHILIKSTLNIGATTLLRKQFKTLKIFYSPEFLKEGSALYDNLHPSRIVVGYNKKDEKEREIAKDIAKMYQNASENKDKVSVFLTALEEAEAIKLFANAFLALRVSFFNELDSYALSNELDTLTIIDAVSSDPRIGNHYNNPSFGYGGYCLPKDIKQLHKNFTYVPERLISGTIDSNNARKKYIAEHIIKTLEETKAKRLGIYRLTMKKGSDNFRESSILDVINYLKAFDIEMIIYEPLIDQDEFQGIKVINDLSFFKENSDLIITNRYEKVLDDVASIVFTRDIKFRD